MGQGGGYFQLHVLLSRKRAKDKIEGVGIIRCGTLLGRQRMGEWNIVRRVEYW